MEAYKIGILAYGFLTYLIGYICGRLDKDECQISFGKSNKQTINKR